MILERISGKPLTTSETKAHPCNPAYMQTLPNYVVEQNCGTRGVRDWGLAHKLAHSSYETIPNS
jgi:hypothetical protein